MLLRLLLISVVAVAPLLAGICGASASAIAAVAVGSSESSPLDGSRQDDAGTLVEENGEDDAEQDGSRIEHGWLSTDDALEADVPGRFSPSIHRVVSPACTSRTALSRGPPSQR